MSPDSVSVIVRAGAFVALFQAAGIAVFLAMFGDRIAYSGSVIRRLGLIAAAGGILLVVAHQALEATRMADDFSGLVDADLQRLALSSTGGAAHATQVLGLVLVAVGLWQSQGSRTVVAMGGATVAISAFLITGHTSVHALRWALAPLLALHLCVVAFWFGALLPLIVVTLREAVADAAWIMDKFSAIAGWLVPGILLAGLAMAFILAPDVSVLRRPYGKLLAAKVIGFGLLMGLAALNKWRWVPALAAGETAARGALGWSIATEYALIAAVLSITAVLTAFYSPEH